MYKFNNTMQHASAYTTKEILLKNHCRKNYREKKTTRNKKFIDRKALTEVSDSEHTMNSNKKDKGAAVIYATD